MTVLAALDPQSAFVQACYIVSFSLFIVGIRRGTHPTTAKQGNLIAATGMAIAVATTLALQGIGNWGLIAIVPMRLSSQKSERPTTISPPRSTMPWIALVCDISGV